MVGFDSYTSTPSLYQINSSGTLNFGKDIVKLAIHALLEAVESGGKNIEVVVMTKGHDLHQLEEAETDAIVVAAEIEAEKVAAKAARKDRLKDT